MDFEEEFPKGIIIRPFFIFWGGCVCDDSGKDPGVCNIPVLALAALVFSVMSDGGDIIPNQ